jgi:crotonobetainyl-CoA:carnitine CoA-transferase CaiB-like acyl-CoA transferase
MVMGALDGIRIVDFSRVLAGPWATQLLADLGADVIKVERPGHGDDTRGWGPPFLRTPDGSPTDHAAYFCCTNRNKRSVAIDFATPDGRQLIRDLVSRSDVFIENLKVGTLARYGLDYESLKSVKRDLIYCSITGFGQDGPRASEAGYDLLIQGMGGLMSVTGLPDGTPGGGPLKVGVALVDVITGLYASSAILAALRHRDRSGEGQRIDLALLDCLIAALANQSHGYLVSGKVPPRLGNAHPSIVPYESFPTADGHVLLAVGNDDQFRRFCAVAGLQAFAHDPKFETNAARVTNRAELVSAIAEALRRETSRAWVDKLAAVGVPCGPINALDAVFEDPQVCHRQIARTLPHAAVGCVASVANPIRTTAAGPEERMGPPVLAEHTASVLKSVLGLKDEEIADLISRNVVQQWDSSTAEESA